MRHMLPKSIILFPEGAPKGPKMVSTLPSQTEIYNTTCAQYFGYRLLEEDLIFAFSAFVQTFHV